MQIISVKFEMRTTEPKIFLLKGEFHGSAHVREMTLALSSLLFLKPWLRKRVAYSRFFFPFILGLYTTLVRPFHSH